MKFFTFIGWSGSGKTTVITRLVEYFKERGLRVGAVKRVHHYSLQPQGKDSGLFLEAGALRVCVVAPGEFLVMERLEEGDDLVQRVVRQFVDMDMVLMEGLALQGIPAIEVFSAGKEPAPKMEPSHLAALITDEPLQPGIACFGRNEIEKIARFLEEYDGTKHRVKGQ